MDWSARVVRLHDPRNGMVCVKCGGGKAEGELLCQGCSTRCPDEDCHSPEPGRVGKDPGDEMCPHCAGWCRGLDRLCQGKLSECSHRECLQNGFCVGPSRAIPRSGFYVYRLDNGYVGMTYNPSERQTRHQAQWESHWDGVRRSDKKNPDGQKIRWLSPLLDSREEAFRCEWALKSYRDLPDPRFQEIFRGIRGVSSVPAVELHPPELRHDGNSGGFLFRLGWKFSGDLGPSQIVPVEHYELDRLDVSSGSSVVVERMEFGPDRVENIFPCSLSSIPGDAWRVRAVNDLDVPGPWSPVSEPGVEGLVQGLVDVRNVRLSLRERKDGKVRGVRRSPHRGRGREVDVAWDVAGDLPGLAFEVKRRGSRPGLPDEVVDDALIPVPAGGSFTDLVEPDEVLNYRYRVRAILSGVPGGWVGVVGDGLLMVGGPEPGVVGSLRSRYESLGVIRLAWRRPEWRGCGTRTGYEVHRMDDDWVLVHSVSHNERSEMGISVDVGPLPADHRFRVRALNKRGPGPWIEKRVCRDGALDFSESLESSLGVRGLLCRSWDPESSLLELAWNASDGISEATSEVESWESGCWVGVEGAGTSCAVRIDVEAGLSYFYRVRMVLGEFWGKWSNVAGVLVVDTVGDLVRVPPLRLPEGYGVCRLFAVSAKMKGRDGILALDLRVEASVGSARSFGQDLRDAGIDVLGRIADQNSGGWVVEWSGEQGFLPNSLSVRSGGGPVSRAGRLVRLAIESIKPDGQFIFNERGPRERVGVRGYRVGDLVHGTVVSIADSGVFVDLVDLEGMIHRSELSGGGVRHPRNVVVEGQVVWAKVIEVDVERGRLRLSMKQAGYG